MPEDRDAFASRKGAAGPDEELLGVVVHSGLVLGRSKDVVAAVRRITAFPSGLALDTVVLARGINAEAAGRRAHLARAHRRAAETAQREDVAAAWQDSEAAARREGAAAAERHHAQQQAIIERRYLPSFDEGDRLRLGAATPAGEARWLDAYAATRSQAEDRYQLNHLWLTPLPADGLLTLVCGWPEIDSRIPGRQSSSRTWPSAGCGLSSMGVTTSARGARRQRRLLRAA